MKGIIFDWRNYLKEQKALSDLTLSAYIFDLENLISFLKSYFEQELTLELLANLDTRSIRSWLSYRFQNNYSHRSNSRALSAVKNFYGYLEKKYNVKCHALYAIKSPRKSKTLPKALSQREIDLSINHLDSATLYGSPEAWVRLRNKALLTLIYATGMRISEALSLTEDHLKNPDNIKILGKRNKERLIPWIKESRQLVLKYVESVPFKIPEGESIFRGEKGGILQRAVFNKVLINLRRALGLPETLSAHAFRHSFATILLENGGELKAIQELLGHQSLSTTQIYTKINASRLMSVYEKTHPES